MPRPVLLAVEGEPAARTAIGRELRSAPVLLIKLPLGHLLPGVATPRGRT